MRTQLRLTKCPTHDFDQLAAFLASLSPEETERMDAQLQTAIHHFAQWHEVPLDDVHDRLAGALWGRR